MYVSLNSKIFDNFEIGSDGLRRTDKVDCIIYGNAY